MPSTHLSLHYHLVFGTKDHRPTILESWRADLHGFLGGAMRTLGGVAKAVGGVEDHVHMLVGLRATHCLADTLRELKSVSSRWVHESIGERRFSWQEGYGAFTVSASQCPAVCEYIAKQEEHHRGRSFREEYQELLTRNGVEFDARYLL